MKDEKFKAIKYTLKHIPLINLNKIKFNWNGLDIKVQFYYINQETIKMGIGFYNKENTKFKYENWISKDIIKINGKYEIQDSLIQHPPYKFYSKKIKSLFDLYDKIFLLANDMKNQNNFKKNIIKGKKDTDRIYYFCTAKSNNISPENKEKIIRTCGVKFYYFLKTHNLTAKFTDDITKSRIPEINS